MWQRLWWNILLLLKCVFLASLAIILCIYKVNQINETDQARVVMMVINIVLPKERMMYFSVNANSIYQTKEVIILWPFSFSALPTSNTCFPLLLLEVVILSMTQEEVIGTSANVSTWSNIQVDFTAAQAKNWRGSFTWIPATTRRPFSKPIAS